MNEHTNKPHRNPLQDASELIHTHNQWFNEVFMSPDSGAHVVCSFILCTTRSYQHDNTMSHNTEHDAHAQISTLRQQLIIIVFLSPLSHSCSFPFGCCDSWKTLSTESSEPFISMTRQITGHVCDQVYACLLHKLTFTWQILWPQFYD